MKRLMVVLKGLTVSVFVTIILIILFAFVMLQLQPDLTMAETGILVIYVLSVFAGGWFSGKKTGNRKYLWGMLNGILYFLILLAVSVLGDRMIQSDITEGVTAFLLCAAGGMLGGMLA